MYTILAIIYQDTSVNNLAKYAQIENFAKEFGITFYPAGRGIGHQVLQIDCQFLR